MKPHRSHHNARGKDSPANIFAATMNKPMAEAMGRSASLFGRSFSTLQQESMRFASQCVEKNMKTVEELGACKSLPDVFAVQQRWFADMARACGEEWMKCSELLGDAMQHEAKEAEHGRVPDRPEQPH